MTMLVEVVTSPDGAHTGGVDELLPRRSVPTPGPPPVTAAQLARVARQVLETIAMIALAVACMRLGVHIFDTLVPGSY